MKRNHGVSVKVGIVRTSSMINLVVDNNMALSLVKAPTSPTYEDELTRRINAYNKLRVREMDYMIDNVRYKGLTNAAFLLFSRELKSLPKGDML